MDFYVRTTATWNRVGAVVAPTVWERTTGPDGTVAVVKMHGTITGFLTPEAATLADNERLVGNVASFLVTGDKDPGAPEAPAPSTPSFGGGATGGATTVPTATSPTTPEAPANETGTPAEPATETETAATA